ncbi:hypothetical protein SESBI_00712 [Sesbania bispinosa]|nr:hypothetical protein SESBI_00712 [Sesbania bispinosa]
MAFTVESHHMGSFVNEPKLHYAGGKVHALALNESVVSDGDRKKGDAIGREGNKGVDTDDREGNEGVDTNEEQRCIGLDDGFEIPTQEIFPLAHERKKLVVRKKSLPPQRPYGSPLKRHQGSNYANLVEDEPEIEWNDGGDGRASDGGIGGGDEEMAVGGNEHEAGGYVLGDVQGDVEGKRPHVTTFIPPNVEDMHVMNEEYNFEELVNGESDVDSDGEGKPIYESLEKRTCNDSVRCRVKCKHRCNFLALVSKVGGGQTYRMKTLIPRHTCGRVFNNNKQSLFGLQRKW